MFYREQAGGTYATLPYSIAEFAVEVPYLVLQATLYSCIVYWCAGLHYRLLVLQCLPGLLSSPAAADAVDCAQHAPRCACAAKKQPPQLAPRLFPSYPARRLVGFQPDAGKFFMFLGTFILTLMYWTFFGRGPYAMAVFCCGGLRQQAHPGRHTCSDAPLAPACHGPRPGIQNVHITPTLQIANAFTSFMFGVWDLFCVSRPAHAATPTGLHALADTQAGGAGACLPQPRSVKPAAPCFFCHRSRVTTSPSPSFRLAGSGCGVWRRWGSQQAARSPACPTGQAA